MLHTKVRQNRQTGSKEEDLKAHDGNLGHVTNIILIDFHFLAPKS